jgi:hypothetical protein
MTPLNDDELNALLAQAKRNQPEPREELALRALRTYRANVVRRPVSVPWPLGIAAAVFLVFMGALAGYSLRRPSVPVDQSCAAGVQLSSPPVASLSFKEFQPVSQIRPRTVRSIRDDQ